MISKGAILRSFLILWCLSCIHGFHSGAGVPMLISESRKQSRVNRLDFNKFFSPLGKMRDSCDHHGSFHFDPRPATFSFLKHSK